MGNISFLVLLLFLFIGCAKKQPTILDPGYSPTTIKPSPVDSGKDKPIDSTNPQAPLYFKGEFQSSQGHWIDLQSEVTKPVIIIFSQESCLVCRKEAQVINTYFEKMGHLPTNIQIYTLLVGAYLEDTHNFKEELGISWTVGYQESDELFRSYCPAGKVPCVIVQTPEAGFVFQKTGEFSIEEIEQITGTWK